VGVLAGCGAHDGVEPTDDLVGVSSEELRGCEAYNTYTAALGDATVACLGSIPPDAYYADRSSMTLQRKFDKCIAQEPDPNNLERDPLRDIDDLLSLQNKELHGKDLPRVGYCMSAHYLLWQKMLADTGVNTCPDYTRVQTFGMADEQTMPKYIEQLPKLGEKPTEVGWYPEIGKTYSYFKVSFPGGKNPNKGCRDAVSCALACGNAFAGFNHKEQHPDYFVGDPTWWVGDAYPPGANPYLAPGYYHPMSFELPSPGALYGHRNRKGEACSKYVTSTIHYTVGLIEVCANPVARTGCMSKCAGPAVNVYADSAADAD
jgi:hypothetical protein